MTKDLETGVVTFLFTDIVGSTRLWDRVPEPMRAAVERHDALGRAAIENNRGSVVKLTGDGFHAAFDDPLDALSASLAFQHSLEGVSVTSGVPLEVRCGMHAGTVERRDNDYFGAVVNHAQRVMDAAHGGQILLSEAVANLVDDRLPAGVALRDLGAVRLRDLTRAKHVFQVVDPRLRQQFPALRSLEATPNNLPQQVTSFIGRERELHEISQLLPKARLLTLIGTGGIGKTRLILQLAANCVDRYPDGVWYVHLDAVTDPALVVNELSRVLGLAEVPGTPLIETVCFHTKSQRTLILFDGCEHLLNACARLADTLLRAGHDIQIAATSREPLRIAGEQTVMLPTLSLPVPTADLATLLRADAVRLFLERARAHQPDLVVTEQNAPSVAKICTRLDGIPLALELAAARVGSLPLETIAARLDDRFALLTSGDRTAMPRQQTLRALIDWSYDLLDAPEKRLFARLSVFVGGWTLDAAEAACGDAPLSRADILDLMDRLVQKSLVVRHEHDDRYGFLETIHDYASDRLGASGEAEALRDRHEQYFLALAIAAEPALRRRTDELPWLRSLEGDHANLKAALQWSLQRPGLSVDALRMCGSLGRFWRIRGHWREGRDWCFKALEKNEGAVPKDLRANALTTASVMSARLGETAAAEAQVETALALAREAGNRSLEAGALNNLSTYVSDRGDFARAHSLLREAVAINHELGNREWESINLGNIGELFMDQGDLEAAQAPLERAVALGRQIGGTLEAMALSSMAGLAERRGDHREARRLSAEALAIYRGLASPAEEEVERMPVVARLCVVCGELRSAAQYLAEALRLSRRLGYRWNVVRCLDGMIEVGVKVASYEKAAVFRGACERLRESAGILATPSEVQQSERCGSECRVALGDAQFAAAETAGRGLPLESVIDVGIEWLEAIARAEPPSPAVPAAKASQAHAE